MSEPTPHVLCVTCQALNPPTASRPEPRKPRPAEVGNVCLSCRNRMERDLQSIIYETESFERPDGSTALLPPLFVAAYTNLLPGRRGGEAGVTRAPEFESRLPASGDILSLVGPGARYLSPLAHPSDQHGALPLPFLLHQWVIDWRDTRAMKEALPPVHVGRAVKWLLARLDWACGHHPAIDEFAADVFAVVRTLRGLAGRTRLVHLLPVPCPTCGAVNRDGEKGLRREDGAQLVECHGCGRLWTEDEYQHLARTTAADLADAERSVVMSAAAEYLAGPCPQMMADGSRCGAPLSVRPTGDAIGCETCGATWPRRRGGWLRLKSFQAAVEHRSEVGT